MTDNATPRDAQTGWDIEAARRLAEGNFDPDLGELPVVVAVEVFASFDALQDALRGALDEITEQATTIDHQRRSLEFVFGPKGIRDERDALREQITQRVAEIERLKVNQRYLDSLRHEQARKIATQEEDLRYYNTTIDERDALREQVAEQAAEIRRLEAIVEDNAKAAKGYGGMFIAHDQYDSLRRRNERLDGALKRLIQDCDDERERILKDPQRSSYMDLETAVRTAERALQEEKP